MYVYQILNLINNKKYIGITKDIKDRWQYHKTRAFQINHKEYNKVLYQAIRKYGLENFQFSILEENLTPEEARVKEKYWIQKLNTMSHDHGYNVTPGGELDCARGEQVNTSKLTEQDIINIRTRRNSGERVSEVFKDYKNIISYNNFGKIWRDENWKHIQLPKPKNMLPSGASLDIKTILIIKDLFKEGFSPHEIAVELNLEYRKVWRICTGRTYANIN